MSTALRLKALCAGVAAVALMALAAVSPAWASVPFGIESFEDPILAGEGAPPATQAGSHPYSMTTTIVFNHKFLKETVNHEIFVEGDGNPKSIELNLPPGLIVNPDATVEKCTLGEYHDPGCPPTTIVGAAEADLSGFGLGSVYPIYNMVPPPGVPAELYFEEVTVGVVIMGKVRTGGDYGLSAEVSNITQRLLVYGAKVTLWGDPYAESHDAERGLCGTRSKQEKQAEKEEYEKGGGGGTYFFSCPVGGSAESKPFLTMPSSCPGESLVTSVSLDSWQEPEKLLTARSESPPVTGCEKLQFNPALSVQPAEPEPQAASPESPSGLAVGLQLPQEEGLGETGMGQLATSNLKEAVVSLPAGVTVSPSGANGLETCSPERDRPEQRERAVVPQRLQGRHRADRNAALGKAAQGAVFLAQQGNVPGATGRTRSGRCSRSTWSRKAAARASSFPAGSS